MKRLSAVLALVLFVAFLTPSVALAQEGPPPVDPPPPAEDPVPMEDVPAKQGVFGEVVEVDPATGQLTLMTKDGEQVSVALGEADLMLHGSSLDPASIEVGQRVGTVGEVKDGVVYPTSPVMVKPTETSFTHQTGAVIQGEDGQNGVIIGGLETFGPEGDRPGEGVVISGWDPFAPGMEMGGVFTGVFLKGPDDGTLIPQDIKPFDDIIEDFGQKMNAGALEGQGIFSEYVAMDIIDTLGEFAPHLAGEPGEMVQEQFKNVIGEFIPEDAWEDDLLPAAVAVTVEGNLAYVLDDMDGLYIINLLASGG